MTIIDEKDGGFARYQWSFWKDYSDKLENRCTECAAEVRVVRNMLDSFSRAGREFDMQTFIDKLAEVSDKLERDI